MAIVRFSFNNGIRHARPGDVHFFEVEGVLLARDQPTLKVKLSGEDAQACLDFLLARGLVPGAKPPAKLESEYDVTQPPKP